MENKLISEFMGLIYIPWNNLQGYSAPGWWTDIDSFNYEDTKPHVVNFRKAYCKNHLSKIGGRYYKCRSTNELKYSTSWDWLMRVVKKIRDMDSPEKESEGWYAYYGMEPGLTDPDIELVYKNVIQFIKWYNERN